MTACSLLLTNPYSGLFFSNVKLFSRSLPRWLLPQVWPGAMHPVCAQLRVQTSASLALVSPDQQPLGMTRLERLRNSLKKKELNFFGCNQSLQFCQSCSYFVPSETVKTGQKLLAKATNLSLKLIQSWATMPLSPSPVRAGSISSPCRIHRAFCLCQPVSGVTKLPVTEVLGLSGLLHSGGRPRAIGKNLVNPSFNVHALSSWHNLQDVIWCDADHSFESQSRFLNGVGNAGPLLVQGALD